MRLPEEIEDQCEKLIWDRDYVGVVKLWRKHIFPENISYAEAKWEWYKALFEGDCLRIMKLLKMYPTLVEGGWGNEDSRIVEGSPESHLYAVGKYRWQGRTAIHVSARRGCIELLQQVLKLYGLNVRGPSNPSESEKTDKQVNEVASSSSNRERKDENDVSYSDHTGQRNGENAGCFSHNTDTEEQGAGISSGDGATSDTRSFKDTDGRESERHDRESPEHRTVRDYHRNTSGVGTKFYPRKDLLDMLISKDGIYKIDALAIAILHFKSDLFNLLLYAIGECQENSYGVKKIPDISKYDQSSRVSSEDYLVLLRDISKESLREISADSPRNIERFLEEYSILHRDFNFYPAGVLDYASHFCFTESSLESELPEAYFQYATKDVLENRVSFEERSSPDSDDLELFKFYFMKSCWARINKSGESLWSFVLKLQDGQGRTPLHVSVAEGKVPGLMGATIFEDKDYPQIVAFLHTALDGAGKPLPNWFLEEITGRADMMIELAEHAVLNTPGVLAEAVSVETWAETLNKVFEVNGFPRSCVRPDGHVVLTSLVADIIRRDVPTSELVQSDFCKSRPGSTSYRLNIRDGTHDLFERVDCSVRLGPLELACLLMNHEDKEDYEYLLRLLHAVGDQVTPFDSGFSLDPGRNLVSWAKNPFQALHIVAAHGNYKVLKMFLDHPSCDPFVEDYQGNNALHYVMRDPFDCIEPTLLDYVNCQDLLRYRRSHIQGKDILSAIIERQGCVSLLLQAGCEIFKGNNKGQVPYPEGRIASKEKFVSWWHKRQEREFAATTSSFNTATTAISVTATLVATTSYIGPLQPPLSYATDPTNNINQIQYENIWVATFLFCDTLSFYLAIIAIILSLIPSLPVPQQAMVLELQRTKTMMIMAVSVLIPSIICILIAFAASSMAVVSAGNITSSIGGKLTIVTLCISGPFFLAAILLFSIRLLIILFPRTRFIRYVYERTSFGGVRKMKGQLEVEILKVLVRIVRKMVRIVKSLPCRVKNIPQILKKLGKKAKNFPEILKKLAQKVKEIWEEDSKEN